MNDFKTYSLQDWLAYEYSEESILKYEFTKRSLNSNQYIKFDGVEKDNQVSFTYQGIYKRAETQYVKDLESLINKTEQSKQSEKLNLYQIVAKKTFEINQQSEINELKYRELINYSLGGQLFDFVLSEYFPKKRHPECYCALFYAAVVNGNILLATNLYAKCVSNIINFHSEEEDAAKIVLQNIMCLYYLKTKSKNIQEVLYINERLISAAKNLKIDSLQAILWLNRSRLYKSNYDQNHAINSLEKSHELLVSNSFWKQNMYYCMQLAILNDNINSLLFHLFSNKSKNSETVQKSMSWRISQIVTGNSHYSHINIRISIENILKLQSKNNLNEIYESIIKT